MGLAWALPGCGPKPTVALPQEGRALQGLDAAVAQVREDPIKFLREALTETRRLERFTLHFQRQERLGLFAELKPVENIFAEYIDEPFSIRFTWLDEDSEYRQCVYVAGKDDNKVVLLPRHGLFGLPAGVGKYDPQLGVTFGKTRNPITDFGPRRMIERTLDRIEKAKPHGKVAIRVLPPTAIGPDKESCFHLEIKYPKGDKFPCKLQDLYVHTRTRLPVATYLWLPGNPQRTETTLDAMYAFSRLKTDVALTAANFVIDPDRSAQPKPAVARPGGPAPDESGSARTALSNDQAD
jgi:hypothetical protein